MSKKAKIIIIIIVLLLILAGLAAFAVIGYWTPYRNAENTMPDTGTMVLNQQEDGSLLITWPAGVNADRYLLEVLRPAEVPETAPSDGEEATQPAPEVLYSADIYEGTSQILLGIPTDEELTIRVSSARGYLFPFEKEERVRMGERAMEITGVFRMPAVSNLAWEADPDTDQVSIRFEMDENSTCRLYHKDSGGDPVLMESLTENQYTITFGETGMFPVPNFDETHTFAMDVYSEFDGYIYYGVITEEFSVVREDLLGTKLTLNCIEEGNNVFSFSWNETKGEHYELQQYNDRTGDWDTILLVNKDGERNYTTGHLTRYSDFMFRVIAVGGQTLPDSEYAATPDEVQVSTDASVVFSTIWPIKDLEIYSDTAKTQVIGTAPQARAYCILDAVDGMFRIRFEEGYGYIDSNYCMINLPEYMGDICLYDITNSYESLYMVHEYEIPTVTGEVVVGYEKVQMYNEEFLVPLLYPVAQRLEAAAFSAIDNGYKLKIYDAYRPRKATQELYDLAEALLDDPLPEETYEEKKDRESGNGSKPPVTETKPPETTPQPTDPVDGTLGTEPTEPVITYEMMMTDNGRYGLNYFLARGSSRHNQGTALDLTLVSLRTGKDLEMQTSMHDLSWYSEVAENNNEARTLRKIMTEAGFGGLTSEWWHFQDNDARNELAPPAMQSGVTPECWMADDCGWKYRRSNGQYYRDCTKTIDGVEYTFDGDGYLVETTEES